MANYSKRLTDREKEFAEQLLMGNTPVQAARAVMGWKCERGSHEGRMARTLAASGRVQRYVAKRKEDMAKETAVFKTINETERLDWSAVRKYAQNRLEEIRDNPRINGNSRFLAVQALEKLSDPSRDIGLILKWMDIIWRGAQAHCPCCHSSFPLRQIKNEHLEKYRKENTLPAPAPTMDLLQSRLEIIKRADLKDSPHPGQIPFLASPNRHLVGLGPARIGKSYTLALFALLYFLTPGTEVWLLADSYEGGRSEIEYLQRFLKTLFHPYETYLFTERFDAKTGELTLSSRWNTELKMKSARAKATITGREVDAVLVAEPGWVDGDLFEEVRARLSSRLGRIIALGTPKSFGGFLGRLMRTTARDPNTGRIIRRTHEERMVENGSPWNISMLVRHMRPEDNPYYVKSELRAARMELSDAEYASEFEGRAAAAEGAKFHQISQRHLRRLTSEDYAKCGFVVGIDQGEKNFGAVLVGYDGRRILMAREYFDNTDRTIKKNLLEIRQLGRIWLKQMGINDARWLLTIADTDPPIWNILTEMEQESAPWPTDMTYKPRPHTVKDIGSWRAEVTDWINEMAGQDMLLFDEQHTDLLHDQFLNTMLRKGSTDDKDSHGTSSKGWKVNDPIRGDHCMDAAMFAFFTIYTGMIIPPEKPAQSYPLFEEARRQLDYERLKEERRELSGFYKEELGYGTPENESKLYEDVFGRKEKGPAFPLWEPGPYPDES